MRTRLRHVASFVLFSAFAVPSVALAAVTPGIYKGNLYQANGAKIANAPAVVSVVKTKVKITAAKFPIMCQNAMGTFEPKGTQLFVVEGVLKGNVVAAKYPAPSGEVAMFSINGKFSANSFVGKITYAGRCKGTSTVRAAR
jgi:hypothetical protein